jgi:hypothetical protein
MARHPALRERLEIAAPRGQLFGQEAGQREAAVARGTEGEAPAGREADEGARGASGEGWGELRQTVLR